ncbi:hypothetical protein L3i20_v217610 [Paenibacillus sp. L3-i20]|nr:hypothetical protein L3i20_v217610 [Paenibacillus sp. L3-i20]
MKGNKLVLSNGKTYSYKLGTKTVEIDGDVYTKYVPASRVKLDGKYVSTSYASSRTGGGLASEVTYIFNKDGTFHDSKFTGCCRIKTKFDNSE